MKWYKLFDISQTANLPYVEETFKLQGIGTVTARLCRGNFYLLVLPDEGRVLIPRLNNRNPFVTADGQYGALLDAKGQIWLGVKQ